MSRVRINKKCGSGRRYNYDKSNYDEDIVRFIQKYIKLKVQANFRGQRGWATMYGKKILNSNFYVKGAIV